MRIIQSVGQCGLKFGSPGAVSKLVWRKTIKRFKSCLICEANETDSFFVQFSIHFAINKSTWQLRSNTVWRTERRKKPKTKTKSNQNSWHREINGHVGLTLIWTSYMYHRSIIDRYMTPPPLPNWGDVPVILYTFPRVSVVVSLTPRFINGHLFSVPGHSSQSLQMLGKA